MGCQRTSGLRFGWIGESIQIFKLTYPFARRRLTKLCSALASAIGGGVGYVDSVVYVGSRPVAERLATLAALRRDDVKRLPTAARVRFSVTSAWKWEDLSTPRELLTQLADSANAKVVNIDQVPHDLWAAGNLPALPLTDRISLLLAGFDLTFEIAKDGSAIRLASIPAEVVIERRYSPTGTLNSAATTIATAFPDVIVKKSGAQLDITGRLETHELIERMIRGEPARRTETTASSKRFDLRVENQPVGAIIKAIADREALQLKFDIAAQAKLQQRISIDVKQLTLDELLSETLSSLGISHRIEAGVLELTAP